MRVHVVGNLCRDTSLTVARFPAPGETLVAEDGVTGLGGKGLNQAVAAARAGGAATLHAAVARDDVGVLATALSGETGLDLRLVGLDRPTDASTILVRRDGENAIVSVTGCARAFEPGAGLGRLGAGDVLLMQGNLDAGRTRRCLQEAHRDGVLTVLNPSPLFEDAWSDWRDVDLAVMNRGELTALTGADDPQEGAAALLERGVGAVAVTLGARGAFYRSTTETISVAAPVVAARDTAGAGDVFCGVLSGLLCGGSERGPALARGVAAASLAVTRSGALASCPSAAEMAGLVPPNFDRKVP